MTILINRRWFEFYNRSISFSQLLDALTASGLEPLLDDNGNIADIRTTVTWEQYKTHTEPKLRSLTQTCHLPDSLVIRFRNGDESWKMLVKGHRVMTAITAGSACGTKEEK